MGKIATESEAASVAGSSTSSLKCCTKAVAQSYGCKVNGTYDSNQLVQYEHLEKLDISTTINRNVKFIIISGGTPLKCNIDGFGYLSGPPLNTNYQIAVDSSATVCKLSNITCGDRTAWQCDSSSVGIQSQLWMIGNFATTIYVSDTLR